MSKPQETIRDYTERLGITDLVAREASAHWDAIARIPVKRTNGSAAGAFCYKRNRITNERFNERLQLHRNLTPEDLSETFRHELAHVIHVYESGGRSDHGPVWDSYARALGCTDKGCRTYLADSHYLNAEKVARYQYRCADCGVIIRKFSRPKWDAPVGQRTTRVHNDCYRARRPNMGHLVRISAEDITINSELPKEQGK